MLTDRGTEYCGAHDRHEYELYLAVEDIDHTRTRTKSPQTNGICERFHKTLLDEFYRVAFRKRVYRAIEQLQTDLDAWIRHYNEARTHQGRWCFGKTPMQTFLDSRTSTKSFAPASVAQSTGSITSGRGYSTLPGCRGSSSAGKWSSSDTTAIGQASNTEASH